MKVIKEKYPIFSGHVQSVSAIIEHGGECASLVDFLDEASNSQSGQEAEKVNVLDLLTKSPKFDKAREAYESRITRAVVPLHLDPSVVNGANVRTMFGTYTGEDKVTRKTYELEIIKGRSQFSADLFSSIIAAAGETLYKGFRYIKILDEPKAH